MYQHSAQRAHLHARLDDLFRLLFAPSQGLSCEDQQYNSISGDHGKHCNQYEEVYRGMRVTTAQLWYVEW